MKKILIVDDNHNLLDLIRYRLEQNNYEVFYALDGQEGVNNAKLHKPDLIIMDVNMPNMKGIDAVKLLQIDAETKEIPVIFLTALIGDANQSEETKKVSFSGKEYIAMPKPFNAEKLIAQINSLIG